jgi:calcineurin-like phosphoesterase family protein
MNIWFISDEHFGHANIIKYCNRPYKDVSHMDDQLLKNINYWVEKDDILYHLGDFALGNKEKIAAYLSRIVCKRNFLILGNHDRYKPTDYMELGFEWATRFPIIYNKFFILSHEPVFLEQNSPYINCYGHIHQNEYQSPSMNYFNCCVERNEYLPINFKKILEFVEINHGKDHERRVLLPKMENIDVK